MFETKQVLDHVREAFYLRTGVDVTRPLQVTLNITSRCNYRCKMCDIWCSRPKKDLSTVEWLEVIDSLEQWPGSGTKLNVSGGEALLRKDLPEILAHATRAGLVTGIVTNGSLMTAAIADELVRAGLFNVNVSLDSLDPAVNDWVRGVPGSAENAVRAIDLLLDAKARHGSRMSIIVKPIAMEPTLDGLVGLVEFAECRGISGVLLQGIEATLGSTRDEGWRDESPLWPRNPAKVVEVFDALLAMKTAGRPILNSTDHLRAVAKYLVDPWSESDGVCRVGSSNMSIWPDGTVPALCFILGGSSSLGNVRDSTPRAIWDSDAARTERQAIRNCRRNCVLTCQRSRSLAEKTQLYWQLRRRSKPDMRQ